MRNEKTAVWPWMAGVVLVGGVGFLLLRDRFDTGASGRADPPAAGALAGGAAAPAAGADPAVAPTPVQHPLDIEAAADPALPPLQDSDAAALESLAGLLGGEGTLATLLRDHVIARLVGHINLLDKPSVPSNAIAVAPLPGGLQVDAGADGEQIAAANGARYAPYVQAFTAVDAQALARAYLGFYPLVQQAYGDLGVRDAYFNDRLVAVIDHLLQTPQPARPLAVTRDPRGRYAFVDPALQARSVGQKALLRLDLAQQQAVMQQLRALRAAITRG
ncbi:DUF3014 domain-containing protein [Stenotrophomonas sp. C3(2023)]|uniref:DUF3014 domain-containing protein n=1 Tax=Stenotrophomonas sp. C3(2023) TaxID=3080277 RepID=UPI00293C4D8F|nr:DUF3014 domain-containing protein [Stenotrophomonas sp. C3(2023)]MDV3467818.1 DUF3014 domain-containing protein [Stenotrophomonas sp. C3(2023)]